MRFLKLLSITLLVLLIAVGCSDDDSTSPGTVTGNGTLKMYMTDAPGDYDAVNVTISSVSVHYADGTEETEEEGELAPSKASADEGTWIEVSAETMTIDLLTLANGATFMIGTTELAAGQYTQVRLAVESAEVIIDGETIPLTIPSSVIKLIHPFTIEADAITELVLDFDAQRSVNVTGGNNPTYKMNPTIRIAEAIQSGAITGTVTNPGDGATAAAYVGDELVTTSVVDTATGAFTLAFLPQGTYTVVLTSVLEQEITVTDAAVSAGNTTDVGSLTFE